MIHFYNIKDTAVQHFYSWEDGEGFDWLGIRIFADTTSAPTSYSASKGQNT